MRGCTTSGPSTAHWRYVFSLSFHYGKPSSFLLLINFPCLFLWCCLLTQSKEADLQAIEQVLTDQALTSEKFREWKEANVSLVQEICVTQDQQVASEARKAVASVTAAPEVETSLWVMAAFTVFGLHIYILWKDTQTVTAHFTYYTSVWINEQFFFLVFFYIDRADMTSGLH